MIQGLGQEITEIPAFGHDITEVRAMGQLVWQKSIPDYLCFTALEAGTFTLTIPAAVTSTYLSYVEYSLDGQNWTRLTVDSTAQSITAGTAQNPIPAGGKVYWRGSGSCMTALNAGEPYSSKFSSTCRFDASGNITSLLLGVNYVTALANYSTSGVRNVTFANLFRGCTTIVNAEDLILPTFTSYYTYIFYYMFYGCTSLVSSPALTSLELASACCSGMYRECSNLAQSQVLLAPSLVGFCYRNMFQATKVNNVKCLATDISATDCVTNWLYNVSSTGTFIQASGVTWPRGASGIPTGWVDVEKRTMPSGYKQLLQVTSDGTAYIQLSFGFEETDEVAATFSVDTSQTTDKYIVCPQTWNNNSNRYGMGVHNYGQYTAAFGSLSTGNTILTPRTANNGELHNWTYAAATFAVTDKSCSINITGYTFGGITTNLRLFYGYNSNTKGAISSYKHIKGSTTACDFVAAVRESDNTAGLYDLANDVFMTCNGLTAGEEI